MILRVHSVDVRTLASAAGSVEPVEVARQDALAHRRGRTLRPSRPSRQGGAPRLARSGGHGARALDGGRVGRDPFSRRGRNRRLDLRQGRLCSAT